ncbi:hypothetical protein HDV57DRAFT_24129 [Trichoderma longibrachiatum]|uniref:Secreted protein n=1 Tax=Trichoderma longibrachiatum ATCC 18648 TaxID=983965 RepID=A0A2T4CIF9_TRILO|nr:hypothetical protein M440DRAFT_82431 [Trichoderma longibrachiatum ATCC 18648]
MGWPMLGVCYLYLLRTGAAALQTEGAVSHLIEPEQKGGKDGEILPLSSSTSCLTPARTQTSTHESCSHLREWDLCSPVRRCDFVGRHPSSHHTAGHRPFGNSGRGRASPLDDREAGGENRGNKVISFKGQGSAIPAEADELPERPSAPPSRAGHMHTIRTKRLIGVGDDARRGPPR